MTKIQVRRDTAANWTSANPTPASGEPCFETDTNKLKIGDGVTAYNDLPYQGEAVLPDNVVTTDTAQVITALKSISAGQRLGFGTNTRQYAALSLDMNPYQFKIDVGIDVVGGIVLGKSTQVNGTAKATDFAIRRSSSNYINFVDVDNSNLYLGNKNEPLTIYSNAVPQITRAGQTYTNIDSGNLSELSDAYTKEETDNLLNTKANKTDVVTISDTQTITGSKTFTGYTKITGTGSYQSINCNNPAADYTNLQAGQNGARLISLDKNGQYYGYFQTATSNDNILYSSMSCRRQVNGSPVVSNLGTYVDSNGVNYCLATTYTENYADNSDKIVTTAFLTNRWTTSKATTTSSASKSRPAVVIQNYVSGKNWYRVWSDGWIEQGGQISVTNTATVNLLKPYTQKNYLPNIQAVGQSASNQASAVVNPIDTDSFSIISSASTAQNFNWYCVGY